MPGWRDVRLMAVLRADLLPVLGRLPAYGRLAWALLRDPRLRRADKAILLAGVTYLASPLDLIPGIIPILGQVDDLTVVLLALRIVLRRAPPDVAESHLAAHGLTLDMLDGDLARVSQTGRIVTGAVALAGARAVRQTAGVAARGGRWTFRALTGPAARSGARTVGRAARDAWRWAAVALEARKGRVRAPGLDP